MPLRARIVIPVLSVLAIGGAIGAVASSAPGKIPGEIPLLALGVVVAAVVDLAILRRAVVVGNSRVTVRNMIRTYHVDLTDIARVQAGEDGVEIYTRAGQKIVARAISQDLFAKVMGRRTIADDLTHAIATAARGAAGEPALSAAKPAILAVRWPVIVITAGLASLVGMAFVSGSIWEPVLASVSLICFMLIGTYWLYRRRERH
jgi:hypothetical protein